MTESEADLVYALRLSLNRGPTRLFRMQSGNFELADGRRLVVGFPGLSDLIGWRSVVISPDDVGKKFAQFAAIEAKAPKRHPTGDQWRYLCAVQDAGGLAGVAKSLEDAKLILRLPTE